MFLIKNSSLDPYFNLALEEFLFNDNSNNYFLLYRNTPSVIIGKHQNPFKECNTPYLSDNTIPIIRRISGGGTVYHDEGNVNFSLIINATEGKQIDFRKYIKPVLDYLFSIGLKAQQSDRNDILIDGLKISGNAEHVVKKRVLHHGTLLFNSDLKKLSNSLKSTKDKLINTKAVNSVKSKVANISDHLSYNLTVDTFYDNLGGYIKNELNTETLMLSEKETSRVSQLANSKYKSWEWNYAYSPIFSIVIDNSLELFIKKGIVTKTNILGNNNPDYYNILKEVLLNKKYEYGEIKKALQKIDGQSQDIKNTLSILF